MTFRTLKAERRQEKVTICLRDLRFSLTLIRFMFFVYEKNVFVCKWIEESHISENSLVYEMHLNVRLNISSEIKII